MVSSFADRTAQKLEFAQIYFDERRKTDDSGSLIERAHEESFLFHLIGVKDAFLQEINHVYGLGLTLDQVDERQLDSALKTQGKTSSALDEIRSLLSNPESWLWQANQFRNHGIHRTNIPRQFYRGGDKDGQVEFRDLTTGAPLGLSIPAFMQTCLNNMRELVTRLRLTLPPDP